MCSSDLLMSLLLLEQGRGAEAEKLVKGAMDASGKDPTKAGALEQGLLLAEIRQRRAQPAAAEATISALVNNFPRDPRPALALALLREQRGNLKGALEALDQARVEGDPFALVVDATHPFAQTISADLQSTCRQQALPLLRLQRPGGEEGPAQGQSPAQGLDHGQIHRLGCLEDLAELPLQGQNLLLAIGHRQLAQAIALSPGAHHHARLLPNAPSLKVAMAAGLKPERVACLRPTPLGSPWGDSVEAALQIGRAHV